MFINLPRDVKLALDEHKEELIELHKKWLKSPLNGWGIRTTEFS